MFPSLNHHLQPICHESTLFRAQYWWSHLSQSVDVGPKVWEAVRKTDTDIIVIAWISTTQWICGVYVKKQKASKTIFIAYLPQHRPVKITTMRTDHKLRVECPDSDVTQVSNIMQDQNDVNWHVDQSKTWINTTNRKLLRKRFRHSWGITYSVRWGLNKSENVFNLFIKINKRWRCPPKVCVIFCLCWLLTCMCLQRTPRELFWFLLGICWTCKFNKPAGIELCSSSVILVFWFLTSWQSLNPHPINMNKFCNVFKICKSTALHLSSFRSEYCTQVVRFFKPHLAWITVYSGWLWILVFTKVFRWWTQKLKQKKKEEATASAPKSPRPHCKSLWFLVSGCTVYCTFIWQEKGVGCFL